MALGDGPWGAMPFGAPPPAFSPEYTPVPPPAAMSFDPYVGDFVQNAQGQIEDMGTIEQSVILAFSVPRKTLAYATDVGHDFLTIPRLSGAALDAEYQRRATLATPFDQLLARGLVELVGTVLVEHPKDTESRLFIKWRKTGSSSTRTTPVGFG